jgi:hypothetical protein
MTAWQGRALLRWARFLQRTVLANKTRKAYIDRRNAAMRSAHRRGISEDALVSATGLSRQWVRKALRGEPTSE